jgi:hypothetical protein
MTGAELRAARERLGVGRGELAARARASAEELERWETAGVPWAAAGRLDRALWELERDAALANSGLPACPWAAQFAAQPDGPRKDPWALERHIERCSACQARGRYLAEHVRPRPPHPAWAWLPAWLRSVVLGAALALFATGAVTAAAVLLVAGLWSRDGELLAGAGGLALVCLAAGAAAGLTHYLAGPLGRRGFVGRSLQWALTLEALLFVAAGLLALGARLGVAGLGAGEWALLTGPPLLLALAAAGAVAGVVAAAVKA